MNEPQDGTGRKAIISFLIFVLKALAHPVVLLSLFGASVQVLNLSLLRLKLNVLSVVPEGSRLDGLRELLNDDWVYAYTDYSIQVLVLLLAFIFLIIDGCRESMTFFRSRPSVDEALKEARNSLLTLVTFIIVALTVLGGLYALFTGAFASPELVEAYYPEPGEFLGDLTLPPWNTRITISRGILVFEGFLISYWKWKATPTI